MPPLSNATSAAYGLAETAFRNAFARLRLNKPIILPKGSPVSQNNVAREAGKDPTALKKARFPSLVAEIQAYLHMAPPPEPPRVRQELKAARARNRELLAQLEEVKAQRDVALSQMLSVQAELLDQWHVIQRLRAEQAAPEVVVPLRKPSARL